MQENVRSKKSLQESIQSFVRRIISKDLLEENDRLLDTVKLDKDDYHLLKYYNLMVINRPASLFLEP